MPDSLLVEAERGACSINDANWRNGLKKNRVAGVIAAAHRAQRLHAGKSLEDPYEPVPE